MPLVALCSRYLPLMRGIRLPLLGHGLVDVGGQAKARYNWAVGGSSINERLLLPHESTLLRATIHVYVRWNSILARVWNPVMPRLYSTSVPL